jgi:hypothetical protein
LTARALEKRLQAAMRLLFGDSTMQRRSEPAASSLMECVSAQLSTACPITETVKHDYEIAADGFEKLLENLHVIVEKDLKKLGDEWRRPACRGGSRTDTPFLACDIHKPDGLRGSRSGLSLPAGPEWIRSSQNGRDPCRLRDKVLFHLVWADYMKSMAERAEASMSGLAFPNRFSQEPALAGGEDV